MSKHQHHLYLTIVGVTVGLWLATGLVGYLVWQVRGVAMFPIFSYNRPHGITGWLLVLAVIGTAVAAILHRPGDK